LRKSVFLSDNVPLPDRLLRIIDVLKIDISVIIHFTINLSSGFAVGGTLLHSDEMINQSGFGPQSLDPILSLNGGHILPRNIYPVLYLEAEAQDLAE